MCGVYAHQNHRSEGWSRNVYFFLLNGFQPHPPFSGVLGAAGDAGGVMPEGVRVVVPCRPAW